MLLYELSGNMYLLSDHVYACFFAKYCIRKDSKGWWKSMTLSCRTVKPGEAIWRLKGLCDYYDLWIYSAFWNYLGCCSGLNMKWPHRLVFLCLMPCLWYCFGRLEKFGKVILPEENEALGMGLGEWMWIPECFPHCFYILRHTEHIPAYGSSTHVHQAKLPGNKPSEIVSNSFRLFCDKFWSTGQRVNSSNHFFSK